MNEEKPKVDDVLRMLDDIVRYIDDFCRKCEFRKLKRRGYLVLEEFCIWYQIRLKILLCKQDIENIRDRYRQISGEGK